VALGGVGRRNARRRHLNAEVNIINLVDVVLVLLIIFMITAPMMQAGIEVKLPRAIARPMESPEALTVTVARDGQILLGDTRVTWPEFQSSLQAIVNIKKPTGVFVRGDERVPFGEVLRVLGVVRQAGIDNVGLVAEPEERP
jgi:biopolymer transport protein ExbD